MKFYIASRFTRKKEVREIIEKLKKLGHIITRNWTIHEETYPFHEHAKLSKKYSEEDIDGIRECEIFIALHDDTAGSTGMHTEIGAAIALNIEKGMPKIYVVGIEDSKSMFFYHPCVNLRKKVDDVLKDISER